MPQIESWSHLPAAVRAHLVERMHDRKISLQDLNQLRVWIESKPNVPEGPWYKDFGSFKLCGEGQYPKTFLLRDQTRTAKRSSRPAIQPRRIQREMRAISSASCHEGRQLLVECLLRTCNCDSLSRSIPCKPRDR